MPQTPSQRVAFRRLGLRVGLLLVSLSWAAPAASQLTIELVAGLDQKRNLDAPDRWAVQWVRQMPPDRAPYVLNSQGPESWRKQPPLGGLREVAEANRDAIPTLRRALSDVGLLPAGRPALLAATLMETLRPVELGRAAVAHQSRVWQIWEILADASHADTLSASVAVLQVLRELDVAGRLARYPTLDRGDFFGVLVGDPAAVAGWGIQVGERALVPASSSASPVQGLKEDMLTSWTWEEILDPDWLLNQIGESSGGGAGDGEWPDVCTQAEALGLECFENDVAGARDRTYAILAAVLSILVISSIYVAWRRNRRRAERVSRQQERLRERRF